MVSVESPNHLSSKSEKVFVLWHRGTQKYPPQCGDRRGETNNPWPFPNYVREVLTGISKTYWEMSRFEWELVWSRSRFVNSAAGLRCVVAYTGICKSSEWKNITCTSLYCGAGLNMAHMVRWVHLLAFKFYLICWVRFPLRPQLNRCYTFFIGK